MDKINKDPGNLIPGLEVEVFEYGSKTFNNANLYYSKKRTWESSSKISAI